MKICLIANALAVHTQRWAQALAERGHDVTVLSIRQVEIPGVRVIAKSIGPVNATGFVWSLLSYLRLALATRRTLTQLKPDVVNAHYCITHGSIARFAGARPLVVNLWGSDVIWDGSGEMPAWRRWLMRYSLERAGTISSTSRFMLEATLPLLRRHPPAEIIPFGVDIVRFSPRRAGANMQIHIGYIKTLSAKYAPDIFLQAAARVIKEIPTAKFTLAGRGPLKAEMEELCRNLGIADSISLPGFIPHEHVPEAMRQLDILVNCSRFDSESFGVAILEGSATGLAVIATDVGGVHETLIDGKTGYLIPRNDPAALARRLIELARDLELRERLGRAGRELVEMHFDWNRNVERFEALLMEQAQCR